MKRRIYLPAGAAGMVLLVFGALGAVALASPPSGVTPTSAGPRDVRRLQGEVVSAGPRRFQGRGQGTDRHRRAKARLRRGSSTGWHSHPGPVFITVTQGQVTFYEYDDPTCTPHVVSAGQGYVDTGQGHMGRNESGQPAQDVSVIIAPVGGAFRGELDAPSPNCGF